MRFLIESTGNIKLYHNTSYKNLDDILKYGKDKAREVLIKTYNKEIGLDKVLELAKGLQ